MSDQLTPTQKGDPQRTATEVMVNVELIRQLLGPIYGRPTRRYTDNSMCSDVFVFDTRSQSFGRATPLPLNNNLPMTVVDGNRIHLIGGEIEHATIEGEPFGHHPDLYLVGTIREVAK